MIERRIKIFLKFLFLNEDHMNLNHTPTKNLIYFYLRLHSKARLPLKKQRLSHRLVHRVFALNQMVDKT